MRAVRMMGERMLLLILSVAASTAGCPQQCQCRRQPEGVIVECRKQDFFQVPEGFPEDTIEIDLGENDIPVIVSSTFPRLTKLRTLVMDSCNVRRLENYAFLAFPQLENLTLTNNVISTIGPDALHNLPMLKYIYLENNELQTLPKLLFDNLDLVDLYLSNNHFTQLPSHSFQGSNIVNVNLNYNNFNILPASTLLPLKDSLKTFQLCHNGRELAIDSAFQGFHLESLLLRNSSLRNATFLEYVNTIRLDISGNQFDDLDFSGYTNLKTVQVLHAESLGIDFWEEEGTLSPFSGLTYLNLANNQISMFNADIFSHMKELKTLVLEDNPLFMLPGDLGEYVPSLTELHLARCHIVNLDLKIFDGMNNLTMLDIRSNRIQIFPETIKPLLPSVLQMEGNPLHCNCEMLWFYHYQRNSSNAKNYTCNSPVKVALRDLTADQLQCKGPTVIDAKPLMTSLLGDNVQLTCIAEGDPPPEVKWEAPTGGTILISPSYNRTMYKTYAVWGLKRLELKSAGLYKCTATNLLGSVTVTTKLEVVTSFPTPPQGLLNSTFINTTTATSSTTESTTVPSTSTTTATTTTLTTIPTSTVTTSSTLTLPSHNSTSYANMSLTNFTVLMNSSAVVITPASPDVPLNLTSTFSTVNEDPRMTNKTGDNSLTIKIIIIISCSVGFVLLVVCFIFIARQRRLSQKYDVQSNSFDNSNREHLTHKPTETTPIPDVGEEKQKLTQV